jgi:hypothetical protein
MKLNEEQTKQFLGSIERERRSKKKNKINIKK